MTCEKRDIYYEVCEQYREWYAEENDEANGLGVGSCFYWAHCGWNVLTKHGFDVLFQAGSLSWPIVPQSEWLTAPESHFSYLWTPNEEPSRIAISEGKLPEIHIWLALPQRGEIVDFSTGTLPAHAESGGKRRWTGPKPPDYLWCHFKHIPFGVIYEATRDATRFILKRIEDDFKSQPL